MFFLFNALYNKSLKQSGLGFNYNCLYYSDMETKVYLGEVWKDIKGFEGKYQVSTFGRIKSLNFLNTGKERIMRPKPDGKKKYLMIGLSKMGKAFYFLIHRLVAEAFIPNPNNLPEVNHKDENSQNNHVSNLEWCDRKYNLTYGTARKRSSLHQTNNPVTSKPVAQMTELGEVLTTFPSVREAARQTNIPDSNIIACCKGYKFHLTAGGFKWSYADFNNQGIQL